MIPIRLESGFRASAAYFVVVAAVIGVYFALPTGNAQSVAYDLVGGSAVAAILAGIHLHKPSATAPWLLFALGTALFVARDVRSESTGLSANSTETLSLVS